MDSTTKDSAACSRFVHYVTLPTLQEMASHQVALSVWSSYVSSHSNVNQIQRRPQDTFVKTLGISYKYEEESDKMIESLRTPKSIEKLLKSSIESIRYKTWVFISNEYDDPFVELEKYKIEHFDLNWLVWLPNGVIDEGKSVSKMLSAPGLNFKQRFKLMSKFCVEEEIKKIPSSLPLIDSFFSELTFDYDSLLYYWICYLRNELNKIPLNDFNCIDAIMAFQCRYRAWEAFEYFWHRLGNEDQIFLAERLLLDGYHYFIRVFSMMCSQQQNRLLSKIPDKLIVNFWITAHSPKSAMWIWRNFKHLITEEKFATMVVDLFSWKLWSVEDELPFNEVQDNLIHPSEDDLRLFLEMWHSASDQQRDYVIQGTGNKVFDPFRTFRCSGYNHPKAAFEFLYIFLSMKSEDFRRQAILRNAVDLGSRNETPNSMNKIIHLCLPNPADQLEYKKLIMESRDTTSWLNVAFGNGLIDNVILRLKYFSTDANAIPKFLNQVDEHLGGEIEQYVIEVEKWQKFSQFVDEVFSQDVTSGLNIKKKFITTYTQCCRHEWNDDSLDHTIKSINAVFADDEAGLQVVKKNFLDSFQSTFSHFYFYNHWAKFEENCCNKLFRWCLNGDERATFEFIKKFPVDAFADECFEELVEWVEKCYYNYSDELLQGLDKCLKWYFCSVEDVKVNAYKLARINAFQESELFSLIIKHEDEIFLDIVLNWFFDGDKESVLKFKNEKFEAILKEKRNC